MLSIEKGKFEGWNSTWIRWEMNARCGLYGLFVTLSEMCLLGFMIRMCWGWSVCWLHSSEKLLGSPALEKTDGEAVANFLQNAYHSKGPLPNLQAKFSSYIPYISQSADNITPLLPLQLAINSYRIRREKITANSTGINYSTIIDFYYVNARCWEG